MRQAPASGLRAAVLVALLSAAAALGSGSRTRLASGIGSVGTNASGPITFFLRVASATVEVVASEGALVRVTLQDQPRAGLSLVSTGGDRLEAEFDGRRRLRSGKLRIEVPRGSRLDVASLDGRITVRGVGGEVRVRASSGDIDLFGASLVDAEAIDGEIDVHDATGPVAVRTVSGAVSVSTVSSAARLELETASGSVDWRGACGKGCRVDAETVSGRLHFRLERSSSFAISTISQTGGLRDELGLAAEPTARGGGAGAPAKPGWKRAHYGTAEGEIECETFSGDVIVSGP